MRATEYLKPFVTPDPRFSPAPQWWWSGEPLDVGRLCWQMDRLVEMGVHNVSIIGLAPNGTMFGSDADQPPFLSEAWWTIFGQVCDHAAKIGMFIWFYDQIGFSGASFQAEIAEAHPECVAHQLRSASVEGTGELTITCPREATPLSAHVTTDGAIRVIDLTDRTARVTVDAPSKLTIVFTVRQAYDLLSRDACERLLDTVHREFARRLPQHIGKTIVGSFQDELPDVPTWGATFGDTFERTYGYRLEPVIHRLFEEGDAEARRTRVHYHQHRAHLAEQAFFKPFFDWHTQHGLIGGFDQQSPAREARVLGGTEKYADYMQTMRWYSAPGSDHYGNAKLHSSIAFLHDRPRVWIEGFHSTGWGGTIADTTDWLLPFLQGGANLYDPHAVYYSTRKGWWEWAAPSTCWRQPYAMHYRAFAEQVMRLTKLLSRGATQAGVGVLFPTTTVQGALGAGKAFDAAKRADQALADVMGSMRWHQSAPGPLDLVGIDYHVLDEDAIRQADDEGAHGLSIRGVEFHTLILPHVTLLTDEALLRIAEFLDAGGRLYAIGADEAETLSGRKVRWSSLPGARFLASASELRADAELLSRGRAIRAPVATLHRKDGDAHVLFVPAVTGMATEVKWPSWFAPIEHTTIVPERYLKTADLTLPSGAANVVRYDPRDGSTTPVATTANADGTRSLTLDFDGSPFAVLVWSDLEGGGPLPPRAPQVPVPASRSDALQETWAIEYVPTLPTDYADVHDPLRPEQRLPTTPAFRWARGDTDNSRGIRDDVAIGVVRATFGERGWYAHEDAVKTAIPLIYSPEFGIDHDTIHSLTLGPKGHVPEEFIDVGKVAKGKGVAVFAEVVSDRVRDVIVAVGANAIKRVSGGYEETSKPVEAYLSLTPQRLVAGANGIDIELTAVRDGVIRGFWCLLNPARADEFRRPERIVSTEPAQPGTTLAFRGRFDAAAPISGGTVKVSVAAVARVFVDGHRLGRLGGFDPLRLQLRGESFPLPPLDAGPHEVRVEVVEPGGTPPLVVDLLAETAAGPVKRFSDGTWTVARDGGEEKPVGFRPHRDEDRAAWHLYRRPHPLPQARWLDEVPANDVVLDLPLVPPLGRAEVQWFEWTVPPGATAMTLSLMECDDVRLWIDGESVELPALVGQAFLPVPLPPAKPSASENESLRDAGSGQAGMPVLRGAARATLRVVSRQLGGGCWAGPVTYELGEGTLPIGSWTTQGLQSYSGAIRMRQTVDLPAGRATLDLGRVRGTVELLVDGRSVGVRVMQPYRFDFNAPGGAATLELLVTNTLVNHLSTWSPTTWWSPDQLECGVLGSVTLGVAPAR